MTIYVLGATIEEPRAELGHCDTGERAQIQSKLELAYAMLEIIVVASPFTRSASLRGALSSRVPISEMQISLPKARTCRRRQCTWSSCYRRNKEMSH